MAAFSNEVKSWLIEKYAKHVHSKMNDISKTIEGKPSSVFKTEQWKQLTSPLDDGDVLQLTLIERKHLMLSCGSQIRESFALIETEQWLKTYCKGDSVLFVIKEDDGYRRFRIKFAKTGVKTSFENCQEFLDTASTIFSVKTFHQNYDIQQNSQTIEELQINHSLIKKGSSLPVIAEKIMSNNELFPHVQSVSTNLPMTNLSTLIELCLTDSGFPDFVEKVEEELKHMTAEKQA